MIKVSMPKAREIAHTERRLKRDEEMKQFDIDAAETGDDLIQIIKSL